MSRLSKAWPHFAVATGLVASGIGCGHPPLTAYATPQPILLGPVPHLPSGAPAAGHDANAVRAGRFVVTASSRIAATGAPMPAGGAITSTAQLDSLPSILDAAVSEMLAGDASGRLEASEVVCSSVVMYAVFYVFAEEQCTIRGRAVRMGSAPQQAAAPRGGITERKGTR